MGMLDQLMAEIQTVKGLSQKSDAWTAGGGMYTAGMFQCCTDADILSCAVIDDNFEKWLGWLPSTEQILVWGLLDWFGPEGTEAGSITWERATQCGDCPSVEWGKCELMSCFGEVCASSPELDILNVGLKYCQRSPTFWVDGPNQGQLITNDEKWALFLVAQILAQNLNRQLIQGNRASNPREFDGIQVLINTPITDIHNGNECVGAEPVIYDWANAAMSDNICNVVTSVVRRIRRRASFIGGVNSAAGDMVLLMTPTMADALLDWAACGCGPCSGDTGTVTIDALASRTERARLAGGLYGMGQFEVDGTAVPIITTSWIPETSSAPYFCSDIFVLTKKVGGRPIMYGQYQDFAATTAGMDLGDRVRAYLSDGGRFINMFENTNNCYTATSIMKGRIVSQLPWLQGRITDVCAPFVLPPESANPEDDYFHASGESQAESVDDYFYGSC